MSETVTGLIGLGVILAVVVPLMASLFDVGPVRLSRRAWVAWNVLLGALWPLFAVGCLVWLVTRAGYLVRGFAELYRHFVPKKVSVPRATAKMKGS